jgi:hypothetical protein
VSDDEVARDVAGPHSDRCQAYMSHQSAVTARRQMIPLLEIASGIGLPRRKAAGDAILAEKPHEDYTADHSLHRYSDKGTSPASLRSAS